MRLNRYLAQSGVASRRAADELIAAGRVRIDGKIVRELGTLVADGARVEVNGVPATPVSAHTYLLMHKPIGVVTTLHDPQGRRTIAEVLPPGTPRVVPVGRLDFETAGVLLLTDDGELTHRLIHPRYGVEKTYRATIRGRLTPAAVASLTNGLRLDDGITAPAKLRVVAGSARESVVDVTIHEGRNRQVRRMFEALGHPVFTLLRMRFGPILLGDLPSGAVRPLTERELSALRSAVGNEVAHFVVGPPSQSC